MEKLIKFLLLFFIFNPFPSLTFVIDCYYNEWDWNFKSKAYECRGSAKDLDTSPGFVVNVTGEHMIGGNFSEVEALRFMNQRQIKFPPTGIEKFFPNLRGLSFMDCNIRVITNEHLREFPRLFQISYSLNQIEVVPGDMFIYNLDLHFVNFAGNNIKHIGANLLKPLKHLEYVWFERNVCINMNSRANGLKDLKKEIRKKCKMGGKKDCPKIPAVLTRWNSTNIISTCDAVKFYKFTPKPKHILEQEAKKAAEEEERKRQHYVDNVLKITEYPPAIVRYIEALFNEVPEWNRTQWKWWKGERKTFEGTFESAQI